MLIGARGFFRGIEATIWRHSVWNGAYFGMITTLKNSMPEAKVWREIFTDAIDRSASDIE